MTTELSPQLLIHKYCALKAVANLFSRNFEELYTFILYIKYNFCQLFLHTMFSV